VNADGPLVSLVMTAWQPRPEWLGEAVRTALAQRGCRIEVVLVDDGSPEPLIDVLGPHEDERLRLIRVEHGGVYRARNVGLAAACGDWIRYVDSDDVFPLDGTASLLALTDGDRVIAYGATLFCDRELRPVWTMTSRLQGAVAVECLLGRFTVRPPAMLFPRAVLDESGEWDPEFRVAGDWDYVLRALEVAPVRGTRAATLYYRKNPGSVTSDAAAGEEGGRRVVRRYFERHPEQRARLERRAEARLAAQAARAYLTRRRPREAAKRLGRALILDPTAPAVELRQAVPAFVGTARAKLRPAAPLILRD
jgi:glycosyltransferase involved in cell wall biosynthesis